MNAQPWSDKLLTLADWEALPEDKLHHYELASGVLEVNASPAPRHQRIVRRLLVQLDNQLPADLEVLSEVDVIVANDVYPTIREPDVCVVSRAAMDTDPARLRATDVLVAVEILSPRTARTDREVKFHEYAEAGIPHYWMVDLEAPLTITAYQLVDGDYELMAEGDKITLNTPAPLTIELAES